jgi:hypothetical protein
MKGLIYLVQSKGLNYIGSTTKKLNRRVRKEHNCFTTHGFDDNNYSVKVLEQIDFENKIELYKLEQKYIDEYDCVNMIKAPTILGLSKVENDRQYYLKNRKEKIEKACAYQKTEKSKIQRRNHYQYKKSWGGNPQHANNLLKIDVNLFF